MPAHDRGARRAIAAMALAGALLVTLAVTERASAAACGWRHAQPGSVPREALRLSAHCLVNRERARRGLRRLRHNARLARAARRHARDMVRRDYLNHVTPGGVGLAGRVRSTGYLRPGGSFSLGENIGWGSHRLGTPAAIVAAWMRSPGHRANLLARGHRELGVGVITGSPQGVMRNAGTYVTVFGARR